MRASIIPIKLKYSIFYRNKYVLYLPILSIHSDKNLDIPFFIGIISSFLQEFQRETVLSLQLSANLSNKFKNIKFLSE